MSTQRPAWISRLILYSPVIVCLAIMLPRLLSAQFGFFDDGRTVSTAAQMTEGSWDWNWDLTAGRFRPVYRLFFALPYVLFGKEPFWYFIANTILFMLTVVVTIALVLRLGGSKVQAWTTGMLFAISGPIIENYYTLSKGEALQLMLIVSSLLLLSFLNTLQSTRKKIGLLAAITLVLFAAHATKETSLIMILISLAWLIVAGISKKFKRSPNHWSAYAAYLFANILAGTSFIVLRTIFIPKTVGGSYTGNYEFGLSRILASLIRWSGWLIRDYAYLAPLLLIAVIWCLRNRRIPQSELLLNTLIWSIAWMGIFLPWKYTVEYYMLAFALGAAFLGGWLISQVLGDVLSIRRSKWTRILSAMGLAASASLLIIAQCNNIATARIQLAIDAANGKLLEYLIHQIPTGGTVWLNIQTSNEYVEQLGFLKDAWGRTDIQVKLFQNTLTPGNNNFIVTPFVHNHPLLTVRMGVIEANQKPWNQDLQSYLSTHSGWVQGYATEQHFHLTILDLPRLMCPVMQGRNFCTTKLPILDTRLFTYGWQIYRLENP